MSSGWPSIRGIEENVNETITIAIKRQITLFLMNSSPHPYSFLQNTLVL